MAPFEKFQAYARESEIWIDETLGLLGWHSREMAFRAVVAGLHALRDSLPWDEAIRVGACLPVLLRGLYYEGWHPAAPSLAVTSREQFLARISDSLHQMPGVDAELPARAIFALIAAKLPPAELEDAKAVTPKDLHAFWPL